MILPLRLGRVTEQETIRQAHFCEVFFPAIPAFGLGVSGARGTASLEPIGDAEQEERQHPSGEPAPVTVYAKEEKDEKDRQGQKQCKNVDQGGQLVKGKAAAAEEQPPAHVLVEEAQAEDEYEEEGKQLFEVH